MSHDHTASVGQTPAIVCEGVPTLLSGLLVLDPAMNTPLRHVCMASRPCCRDYYYSIAAWLHRDSPMIVVFFQHAADPIPTPYSRLWYYFLQTPPVC